MEKILKSFTGLYSYPNWKVTPSHPMITSDHTKYTFKKANKTITRSQTTNKAIKHFLAMTMTKIFQYCTCPAGRVTYNFHLSCKHMHLSFKSVCNKEHKGVICNMTSSRNSSHGTPPTGRVLGKNYSSFLDFTRNYERTSGFLSPE